MSILSLHIYGPAFGLPSIDVECLAAIALLLNCCGSSTETWRLIPSSDPSLNPFNQLPALQDGDLWIAGFRNIANYMAEYRPSLRMKTNLTFDLTNVQRADTEAYLSFLESRGLPLLDLSLYVSSDNFTSRTRGALSEIFPWPQSWTVPQRLRDDARKRSEHLGLGDLDVDATREKELKRENEGIAAQIPKSLRISKQTVSALLGSTAEQTRFRLVAVTADFFEPFEELLGDKEWFLGDQMTVLDCYALGVLAQMGIRDLPQQWLKDALDKRYPTLAKWAKQNTASMYDNHALLPWMPLEPRTWLEVASVTVNFLADAIPITILPVAVRADRGDVLAGEMEGQSRRRQGHESGGSMSKYERKQIFHTEAKRQRDMIRQSITAVLSSTGLVGWLIHLGVLTMPTFRKSQPMRRNFGEAGVFLGL